MKKMLLPTLLLLPALAFGADNPDESFFETAAQGGLAEVEMGKLAQEKGQSKAVKDFGAMMVKDHTAANEKLKALAAKKGVDLPKSPSVAQMATKTKLQVLTGETFDKSYVKTMVDDHEEDIKAFEKEANGGKDPEAKALAAATLPTLRMHLQHIKGVAATTGVKLD